MQTALNKLKCTPKGKVYNKYVPENILNQKYNIYPFPRTVGQNTKEKLKNIIHNFKIARLQKPTKFKIYLQSMCDAILCKPYINTKVEDVPPEGVLKTNGIFLNPNYNVNHIRNNAFDVVIKMMCDSGSNIHATNNKQFLQEYQEFKVPIAVGVAGSSTVTARGKGKMCIALRAEHLQEFNFNIHTRKRPVYSDKEIYNFK